MAQTTGYTITRRQWMYAVTSLALSRARIWPLGKTMRADIVFAGTYTGSGSKGIYAYRWSAATGELHALGLAAATENPSYLVIAPDGKALYAVNEMAPEPGKDTGRVTAFSLSEEPGKLVQRNTVPSGGTEPCNLAVDSLGQNLFVANYGSGSFSTFHLQTEANLQAAAQTIHFHGHSVNPERQTSPHTHCTTLSPSGRYLLVNDLGLDRIYVYHLDPKTAQVQANAVPYYSAIPGSGPRNLKFHPNGHWAYSANEMGSSLDVLHWQEQSGQLHRVQNLSTLPEGYTLPNTAATVYVHPNGKYVYASNRGHNSIATYTVNEKDGTLVLRQHVSCGGKTPRFFTMDPHGAWLLVANQDSQNIVILRCVAETGMLEETGRQYTLDHPVCLAFA